MKTYAELTAEIADLESRNATLKGWERQRKITARQELARTPEAIAEARESAAADRAFLRTMVADLRAADARHAAAAAAEYERKARAAEQAANR